MRTSATGRSDVVKLPSPDSFGNYWLESGDRRIHGRCILHRRVGGYFASQGGEGGVLFQGPSLRTFATAEEALQALLAVG